ncbi:hypothetical protein H6758_02090 [Candidatus Nomurabacteria bacterium]|nr:hypothetical protein [Candidatus Nomurabacteria bacterium]
MKIVSASNLRKELQLILNEVFFLKKKVLVTKNGKPKAIIHPIPDDGEILITLDQISKEMGGDSKK